MKSDLQVAEALADSMVKLSDSFRDAGKSLDKFRVAYYGKNAPTEDNPVLARFREVAEREGKVLVLIHHQPQFTEQVFDKSWIVYDEVQELLWHRRHVVKWRGKKMVYCQHKGVFPCL